MTAVAVRVRGLRDFQRALKTMDTELPKALRMALNTAGDVVVSDARPRVPRRHGRARSSVRARSTQKQVRVVGGGNKAPYYPWLDFGGRVGRSRSIHRPYISPHGRYIYNAYFRRRREFVDALEESLVDVARAAGVEVGN